MRTVNDNLEFRPSETRDVSTEGRGSDHSVAVPIEKVVAHLRWTGAIPGTADDTERALAMIEAGVRQVIAPGTFPEGGRREVRVSLMIGVLLEEFGKYRKAMRPYEDPTNTEAPRTTDLGILRTRADRMLSVRWNHRDRQMETRLATTPDTERWGWARVNSERWYAEEWVGLLALETKVKK